MPAFPDLAEIPPTAEAMRGAMRAFLAEHQPREPAHVRARSWMGFDAGFSRAPRRTP